MRRLLSLVTIAVLLGGCSGEAVPGAVPSGAGVAAARQAPARTHKAKAYLVIRIPKRVPNPKRGRGPRFISPATESATVALAPTSGCSGCSPGINVDVNFTGAASNCTPGTSGTTCTLQFEFNPGTYTGTIATYDGSAGCQTSDACNTLSANQSFPFTVVPGAANQLAVTLYGVPAKLVMLPAASNVAIVGGVVEVGGTYSTGKVSLYADDADGNLILGPGAPAFSVPAQPSNGWTATLIGNVLQLATGTAYAAPKYASLAITATGPGCLVAGATCAYTVLGNIQPQLALADKANNAVHVMLTDRTTGALTTYATVTNGVAQPVDAKFDGAGNLYVANTGSVTVYAPPYGGAPTATLPLISAPTHVAVDASGDVAASTVFFGNAETTVFDAPSYAAPQSIALPSGTAVDALAFEWSNESLWVASSDGAIRQYLHGSSTANTSLPIERVAGMDFDKTGDLYVADQTTQILTEYPQPGYGAGASVTLPGQPTSVVNFNTQSVAGYSTGAALYSGAALELASVIPTSAACMVTADYVPAEYWLESPFNATESEVAGPGTSALVPFVAASIAAFPRPDANY